MFDVFTEQIEVLIKDGIANLYWYKGDLQKAWLRAGVPNASRIEFLLRKMQTVTPFPSANRWTAFLSFFPGVRFVNAGTVFKDVALYGRQVCNATQTWFVFCVTSFGWQCAIGLLAVLMGLCSIVF